MLGFRLFRSFATRAEIFPTVRNVLIERNNIEENKIKPDATFSELGLDVFDGAELVMGVLFKLQVQIDPKYAKDVSLISSIPELTEFAEKLIPN